MSVEALAIAMHHSRASGAQLLVLLGIANHDGDGGAWPAVATLAHYARTSPRQVQRHLRALESLGEIRTDRNAGGTQTTPEAQRPNRYHFRLTCPPDCDRSTAHRTRRRTLQPVLFDPVTPVTPPVTGDTPPLSPMSPEPSYNPPGATENPSYVSQRARAIVDPCPSADGARPDAPKPHRWSRHGFCTNGCGATR